jgi:hypothetical protein
MAIPEQQLSVWSNIGATVASTNTYNSIKTAIDGIGWKDIVQYDLYLQGSYRNSTNIRGDSDVDVIAQLTSIFHYDTSSLSQEQSSTFQEVYSKEGEFTLSGFREATFKGLQEYYDKENVSQGSKAIDIIGFNGRLNADVLCCLEFRKYKSFSRANTQDYISGIKFYSTKESRWVINFPKIHYDNGVNKNSQARTNQNYKPVTRIFKNLKSHLVQNNIISSDLAPSYFIQCLLYNLPDNLFRGNTYQSIVVQLLNGLVADVNNNRFQNYVCQNEQLKLFGETKEQWNTPDAIAFIKAIIELYKNW